MEESPRVVPVFLGMSSELDSDRQELGSFFAGLNDIAKGHGVYFRLVRWRPDLPDGLSHEVTSVLEGCELAAFLFFTTADEDVEDAFEAAFAAFREKGSPQIVTWFHVVPEGKSVASELEAFRARLEGELHHFYSTYDRIEMVELGLVLQLARGTLGGGPADLGEGEALTIATDELCLWGKPVMGLSGVPAYQGWTAIAQAQSQLAAMEADYQEARARYREHPNDASAKKSHRDLLRKRNSLLAELERAQYDFLKTMQEMARRTSSTQFMTERQRQAYRLLEAGKPDVALALLDPDEIADDVGLIESQLEVSEAVHQAERASLLAELRERVQEMLLYADLLGSRPMTSETLRNLEKTLRKAADIEGKNDGLGIAARVRLAQFLLERGRFTEATSALHELGQSLSSVEECTDDDSLVFDLAHAFQTQSGLALARREFDKALGAIDRAIGLAKGESSRRKLLRASLLNQAALVLVETGSLQVADDALDRAYSLCIALDEGTGRGLLVQAGALMAAILNKKAEICLKTGRPEQAEEMLGHVVSVLEGARADDQRALNDLATSYISFADARYQRGDIEGQLAYARKAMGVLRQVDKQNPGSYLFTRAMAEGKAGSALRELGRPKEAETLLRSSAGHLRELCEQGGVGMYGGLLCGVLDELACVYDELAREDLALQCCEDALSVGLEIAHLDPGLYRAAPVGLLSRIAERVAGENPYEALRLYERAADLVCGWGQTQDAQQDDILAGLLGKAGNLGIQLGDCAYAHDRLSTAALLFERAYDATRDSSLLWSGALVLLDDRSALLRLERYSEAEDAVLHSVELARKYAQRSEERDVGVPHRTLLALSLYYSAQLHAGLEEFERARSEFAEVLDIARYERLPEQIDLTKAVSLYSICLSEISGSMAQAVLFLEREYALKCASSLEERGQETDDLSDCLFAAALELARMTEGGKFSSSSLVARNWWFVARRMLLGGEDKSAETALSRALDTLRSLGREKDARDCSDDINELRTNGCPR